MNAQTANRTPAPQAPARLPRGLLALTATLTLSALCAFSAPAAAREWVLDNASSELNFISIKASDLGEVHRFGELAGTVEADGSASVIVQLASVDTLIPVRDERMRELLFETSVFPLATLTTRVDVAAVEALGQGESMVSVAEVLVELHGEAAPLMVDLRISRLSENRVAVTSQKPLVVNAGTFSLVEGIEALREVAGLPNISKAVPVQFFLTFEASGD